MLLSEIAEKIIKKESNLSLENEVIVGNREEWYEESLIDPLIDYYSYDVLRLCGCGCPNDTLDVIRKYLHIRKDWKDNKCDYDIRAPFDHIEYNKVIDRLAPELKTYRGHYTHDKDNYDFVSGWWSNPRPRGLLRRLFNELESSNE